jgi:hypothetical protein
MAVDCFLIDTIKKHKIIINLFLHHIESMRHHITPLE